MPSCNREANLVVKLGRRRDVAFLLDVESHAGGPDQDAATLRSERLGDNSLFGLCSCADCCECSGFSCSLLRSRPEDLDDEVYLCRWLVLIAFGLELAMRAFSLVFCVAQLSVMPSKQRLC